VNYLSEQKSRELLDLKQRFGFWDPRLSKEMENCDICANDLFRSTWKETGVEQRAFEAPPPMGPKARQAAASASNNSSDVETLVQTITDRVLAELSKRSA
jgi:L-fuculose-phosphate aldolase